MQVEPMNDEVFQLALEALGVTESQYEDIYRDAQNDPMLKGVSKSDLLVYLHAMQGLVEMTAGTDVDLERLWHVMFGGRVLVLSVTPTDDGRYDVTITVDEAPEDVAGDQ